MQTTIEYDVVLIPAEEGGYTVIAPSLPGCISEGDTEAEALENMKDAIHGWLSVAEERGLYVPAPDAHRLKLATVGVTE
ncbi:MAG: type II toxin-antitoxin system HicB family antitoxin [Anaerolineae bacterium]